MLEKTFKPAKLAQYNDDGINAEIIIENDERSIRVISLDAHQKISTHTTEMVACIYVLEGEIEFTLDTEVYDLVRGEMIIVPAQTPHSLFAKEMSKMILIKL